ncbi:Maf-like protein [Glycine max]|nr:Maf-like protein [Glycine max]
MATKNPPFKIILGSSSKARREILSEMGYEFTVMTADIDEKCIRREKPEDLVMALAEAKADAIVQRLPTGGPLEEDASTTLLITADTVVVYRGVIREKPTSEKEARDFIKGYSGSHAAVVGSVVVTNLATGKRCGGWDSAEVYFLEIPDEVIDNLFSYLMGASQIDEGITFNVAGGLMLEHPLTLPFVDAVVGSTDTVMGLSKALTEKLLLEAL